MPAAFGSKFDRKSVEELCARRMKDYAQLGIFEFQPKGTLPIKKSPKGPAPADVREKLFPRRRQSKGHKGASKRSPRPVTPLKMWPNRADQFQPLDEVESSISDETTTSFEEEDPNLFVIGSSPRKKRNPKPNFEDTTKTRYASRPSLEMNGYRNSVQADDARPHSLEIRNKCHRVRASVGMKNPSIASELDPDLLETTDDEDNIIHTPYPEQLVVRSTSYRLDEDKPVLGVGREASVPALSTTQSEFAPLPSHSVDCMGMKSWGFRWAANKLCRMPVGKRH